MKRRIKVMAAMLACLAMLATAAPSQAMQQADAAAGASTTVNDMSYVYPVSYTHLDVYKRQVYDTGVGDRSLHEQQCALPKPGETVINLINFIGRAINFTGVVCFSLGIFRRRVVIDVYKRQS